MTLAEKMARNKRRRDQRGNNMITLVASVITHKMTESEVRSAVKVLPQWPGAGKQRRKQILAAARKVAGLPQPTCGSRRIRSASGTWAIVEHGIAHAMTHDECVRAGVAPGRGND